MDIRLRLRTLTLWLDFHIGHNTIVHRARRDVRVNWDYRMAFSGERRIGRLNRGSLRGKETDRKEKESESERGKKGIEAKE